MGSGCFLGTKSALMGEEWMFLGVYGRAHGSWGLGAHGARGVGVVEMVEVRMGFGFMLSRTEVLARLMVGPAIRHWRAVPNASPAHQAQKDHSRFKAGA